MDLFARSVEAVMNAAKVDKAIFVGHSMGMPVARQIYRTSPQKVLGIVNVDGSIRAFPDRKQTDEWIANFRSDYQKTRDQFVESMVTPIKDENVKRSIRTSNQATPDYVGISAISQFGNDALWKTDPIKVPVLAIFAEGPFWPPDTETFHRSIAPDLEFHMWKGVTHFLMMEKPKEFNDLIQAFAAKKKLL
jgi:pimeloyl-ACP methyl ester carboxylesterase